MADFNFDGFADVVFQQRSALGNEPQEAKSFFLETRTGRFDVFTPPINTPGLRASAVGNFDLDDNSEILFFDPDTGNNYLFNNGEDTPWTVLSDPNNPEAPLQTPKVRPLASVDLNRDGVDEIIYRNDGNELFNPNQNFTYDPLLGQFGLLSQTEDLPLAGGEVDGDGLPEIVSGDPVTGVYRIFNPDTGMSDPLNPKIPNQTVPNLIATGTIRLGPEVSIDFSGRYDIVFQDIITTESFTYNWTTGNFFPLATTPGFQSLA